MLKYTFIIINPSYCIDYELTPAIKSNRAIVSDHSLPRAIDAISTIRKMNWIFSEKCAYPAVTLWKVFHSM